jgi:sigma-B regulation protein RsbU (phosphoserine phosphatase)
VGIRASFPYESGRCTLTPGEGIFLFTDGITEGMDGGGALFSEERLEAVLRPLVAEPPATLVSSVIDSLRAFAGGAPQSDDVAALAIRRAP